MISTTTDSLSKGWAIDDEVTRLRLWATDIVYPLLCDDRPNLLIGTAPTCAIRVHDPRAPWRACHCPARGGATQLTLTEQRPFVLCKPLRERARAGRPGAGVCHLTFRRPARTAGRR